MAANGDVNVNIVISNHSSQITNAVLPQNTDYLFNKENVDF